MPPCETKALFLPLARADEDSTALFTLVLMVLGFVELLVVVELCAHVLLPVGALNGSEAEQDVARTWHNPSA